MLLCALAGMAASCRPGEAIGLETDTGVEPSEPEPTFDFTQRWRVGTNGLLPGQDEGWCSAWTGDDFEGWIVYWAGTDELADCWTDASEGCHQWVDPRDDGSVMHEVEIEVTQCDSGERRFAHGYGNFGEWAYLGFDGYAQPDVTEAPMWGYRVGGERWSLGPADNDSYDFELGGLNPPSNDRHWVLLPEPADASE